VIAVITRTEFYGFAGDADWEDNNYEDGDDHEINSTVDGGGDDEDDDESNNEEC
jgi:hypothetical protein